MKSISILGSTGSIGCNALKVVEHLEDTRVVALGAGRNVEKLAEQIARFEPELVACESEACARALRGALTDSKLQITKMPEILTGEEGLIAVATHERAETVVSATVGAVGFLPTLRAIEKGTHV